MASTLEQDLAGLDRDIKAAEQRRDKATNDYDRAAADRSINMLRTHGKAAIEKRHADQNARRQAEQAALKQKQDEIEAGIKRRLRSNWSGDDASFEKAYPQLLEAERIRETQERLSSRPRFTL